MSDPAASANVKSATRTLDIIEYVVARGRPLVAQEISTALTIPLSSLSYLLSTLVDRGYLSREGRRYSAGPGLERLQAQGSTYTLIDTVAPLVRALRIQLNETTSFFTLKGWEVETLVTESSEHALRYAVQTGTAAPLHPFSSGKALLATLPEEEFERYLKETDRRPYTAHTMVSEAALRTEIEKIRKTGIAHTREEYSPGIYGLGRAAIMGGEVVGAFSVAIPMVRFDAHVERRVIEALKRTTAILAAD